MEHVSKPGTILTGAWKGVGALRTGNNAAKLARQNADLTY